jgi:hypothetical protein
MKSSDAFIRIESKAIAARPRKKNISGKDIARLR